MISVSFYFQLPLMVQLFSVYAIENKQNQPSCTKCLICIRFFTLLIIQRIKIEFENIYSFFTSPCQVDVIMIYFSSILHCPAMIHFASYTSPGTSPFKFTYIMSFGFDCMFLMIIFQVSIYISVCFSFSRFPLSTGYDPFS